MTDINNYAYAAIVFEDFENDVARRPELRAKLEDLARYTVDWADVRSLCIANGVAFTMSE